MMKEQLTIVKVGGAVVEDEGQLEQLLRNFSAIEGRKVLVHGGGRKATKMAERLGIETKMVEGRRITDADMLEVVTMVYGGLVNKNLVAKLQANGVNALGLTGADADAIRSHKRPLKNGVDYGFVGDVDQANGEMLGRLVEAGITLRLSSPSKKKVCFVTLMMTTASSLPLHIRTLRSIRLMVLSVVVCFLK